MAGGEEKKEAEMIGRLNHVAVAVDDLEAAAAKYRDMLGAEVSRPEGFPDHGVTVVFVELDNTKIELLSPLGDKSPIESFLKKRGSGIHHLCYEVESIELASARLRRQGCRLLGDGQVRTGAHGKPVLFLHPGEFDGTLIELEEA